MLRESTRALTLTFPNSVSVALGISSVSSRNRAAVGFHSTREPFTWYATSFLLLGTRLTPAVTPARARWPARGATRIMPRHDFVDLPGIGKIITLGFRPDWIWPAGPMVQTMFLCFGLFMPP